MCTKLLSFLCGEQQKHLNKPSKHIDAYQAHQHNGISIVWAVCFLNRGKDPKRIIYNWKDHVITDAISERETRFNLQDYSIRDIWSKTNVGTTKEPINTTVSGHDVKLLQLTPVKK